MCEPLKCRTVDRFDVGMKFLWSGAKYEVIMRVETRTRTVIALERESSGQRCWEVVAVKVVPAGTQVFDKTYETAVESMPGQSSWGSWNGRTLATRELAVARMADFVTRYNAGGEVEDEDEDDDTLE